MNRTILAAVLLAGTAFTAPASADVVLAFKLSGTGDNVVFDSVSTNSAVGHLNGQHVDLVNFTDLTGSTTFGASGTGNDIKIVGTNNLFIQVFDPTDTIVVGTIEQVFSLKGTGNVTAFVQANDQFGNAEAIKSFDLGTIGNGQSGFTFTSINGEVMTSLRILDVNGNISDFEHYRIDVAPAAVAVPGPIAGAGIPGIIAACGGLLGFNWRRRRRLLGS